MATDLTPAEHEDKEAERLINKKPPPSRKYTERRGPKYDNRRHRVKDDDTKPDDERKISSLADVALNIMFRTGADTLRSPEFPGKKPPKPKTEPKTPKPKPEKVPKPSKPALPESKGANKLQKALESFKSKLESASPALGKAFSEFAASGVGPGKLSTDDPAKSAEALAKQEKDISIKEKSLSKLFSSSEPKALAQRIAEAWPNGVKDDWVGRASVIGAIRRSVDAIPIPDAFKAPFERGKPGDVISDRKLIKRIIESTAGGPSSKDIKSGVILRFAQLAAALNILLDNPDSIDAGRLSAGMDRLSKVVQAQASKLLELGTIMEEWHHAMETLGPGSDSGHTPGKDFDRVLNSLDSFFRTKKPVVDPRVYMKELESDLKKKYGEVPEEVQTLFRAAASNENSPHRTMAVREAAYHGVKEQGHPSGPTVTGYRSYDKRYFSKENFDSILKFAKQLMEEDWLKYDWEGGAPDARFRAALDLSIHLADDNLYQSKIDTETYDMLLNRLAGWDWDTFSETVLPTRSKASRSASNMNQNSKNPHVQRILRVASDLRQSDPQASLEIVKNLRALVSSEAEPAQNIRMHVGQQEQDEEQEGGHTSQQQQQQGQQQEQQGQQQQQQGQQGQQQQQQGQQEQQAVAPGEEISMKSMSDEDFKKLKDEAKKLFDAKDIEEFMKGFDSITDELGHKTASARVPLSLLVRIAYAIPSTRKILTPILAAAKKKDDKKKGKKTSQQEKAAQEKAAKGKGKKPPFGGKKAPPFGKKGPAKGRKASVEIDSSDINW